MLDEKDVKKVAALARLKLTDEEIAKYGQDLAAILEYFEGLKDAETKDVEPLYNAVGSSNVLDDDEILNHVSREDLLTNTPQSFEGFIKVKRVL